LTPNTVVFATVPGSLESIRDRARQEGRGAASVASGVMAGVVVMYTTALLVQL
jgi:hypothetical protein